MAAGSERAGSVCFWGESVCFRCGSARFPVAFRGSVSGRQGSQVKMPGVICRARDEPDMRFPVKPPTVS